ncbi:PSP1-domain-containing protein [Auricularia subglabra TFB-10046 SS5]|nr:PSP1-domain-containing protein [Auricularia subglabra TFB-10046 SS5]
MNLARAASGSGRLASVERRDLSRSPGTSPARHDLRQDTPIQHHSQLQTPLQTPQQPAQQQQQQRFEPPLTELGRGVPLHAVPSNVPLYIVEFKAGRTDLFYCVDPALDVRVGDLVIVEADRGKDLGKVVNDSITPSDIEALQLQATGGSGGEPVSPGGPVQSSKREYNPKRIYGKAQPQDTQTLVAKMNDEMKALQLCQTKVKQKKLPMEVVDAEYQWDRRKLTFYFVAEKRIDFRELVRELFRLYKTRIWMSSLQAPAAE